MEACCSAFFLLLIVGVAFVFYTAVAWGLTTILPLTRSVKSLVLAALLLIVFPALCVGTFMYLIRSSEIYHQTFKEWPSADVKFIDKDYWVLGDSGRIRLVFKASPQTIARLRQQIYGSPTQATTRSMPGRFGFMSEEEILEYDPTTGVAVYYWQGVS